MHRLSRLFNSGTTPRRDPPAPAYLLAALAMVYFLTIAGTAIQLPGLDYDELLFVNAATGGASDSYVVKRVLGVPVMLMSYIGALKAYVYYPIFALLGVSAETIRWPVLLLSLLSLTLVFALGRFTFNRFTSALLVVLTALDPTFIFISKIDYGPIVLMMLLKLLALWCFFRAVTTGSPRYLWGVAAACILGVFDKLNFIWFVVALGAVAVLLFRPELHRLWRRNRAGVLAPLAAMAVALGVASLRLIIPQLLASQSAPVGLGQRLSFVLGAYARSADGRQLYSWLTDTQLEHPTLLNPLLLVALVYLATAGLLLARRRRGRARPRLRHRLIACYGILFCLIAAQIAFTKRAGGPHHMMVLYPFQHVLVLAAASTLPFGRVAVPLVGGLLAASEVRAGAEYVRATHAPERLARRWSPVIYELADYLDRQKVDRILFVDWGIHNQVYALGGWTTRGACRDVWLDFKRSPPLQTQSDELERDLRGRRILTVRHPAEGEIIAGVQARFEEWAAARRLSPRLIREFRDRSGRVIYEVHEIVARASPR